MALDKATIINLNTNERIPVMFNPEEYSLEKGNTFSEIGIPGVMVPPVQYIRGNSSSLSMELFFDTYEDAKDVRRITRRLTRLLEHDRITDAPPILLFSWGSVNFKCVLVSVKQRFTFFLNDGTPVRATLNVQFKEYEEIEIKIKKGFFIGPPNIYNTRAGDTISKISGDILGDPARWREIADINNIVNLRKLLPGTPIKIPGDLLRKAYEYIL